MLADYDRIISILRRCTSSDVSAAEKQLNNLAVEDLQVLSCLQQSLKDKTLQDYIHTLATSHINSLFTTNVSEYTQKFSISYFTNILLDPEIEIINKKQLSRSIMYCIQRSDQQYLNMWKTLTYKCLFSQQIYEIGLVLLNAFTCSQAKHNIIEQIDEKPFVFTMQIICARYQGVQHVTEITYILQTWKVIIEYLIQCFRKESQTLFESMVDSQDFQKALRVVYQHFSTGQNKHYLYINEDDPVLSQLINQMKKVALQLHYLLLSQTLSHQQSRYNPLYQFTGLQMEIFVNSLCFGAIQPHLITQHDIEYIMILMLKILICMTENSPIILSKSWKQLIHFIIFPFLYVSESQMIDFEENTNNFMEVAQDCYEKQKMGILKTQAARYLQRIADLSDHIQKSNSHRIHNNSIKPDPRLSQTYIAKYIINFAIASIKHHLQMQFFNKSDFLSEEEISGNIPILPIQTAFLVLTVFSYCIGSYKRQVQSLKIIICDDRLKNLPPLERARIYTFLAYNYEQIFGTTRNQTTRHWVERAFSEQNHPTVAYTAFDFITNSLQKIYDEEIIKFIIAKIVPTRVMNFWTLLKKFAHLYCLKFSQQILVSFVQQIYKRIDYQIGLLSKQSIKMTYIITSLLQIIKTISQKGQFLSTKPKLKLLLWESSKLFQIGMQHHFEDDVIKIINCFLFYATRQQIQHPQMHNFLPLFLDDFVKADYQPTYYYIALNNYIMKGEVLSTIMPIYNVLKRSLIYFLNPQQNRFKNQSEKNRQNLIIKLQNHENHRKKLPIAHTLLLVQNMLALHGGDFHYQQLQFLSRIVENLYPKVTQSYYDPNKSGKKFKIYDRALLARAFNIQLLCYMYQQNPKVIEALAKYHDFKLFHGYDVSVLLSCMKILIPKQKDLTILIQLLQILIRVIQSYIQVDIQMKIDRINQKGKQTAKYEDNDDDHRIQEEGNANNANLDAYANKKKQALIVRIKKISDFENILAYINTPFSKNQRKVLGYTKCMREVKDIRTQFLQMLMSLRNTNYPLFQSILVGLSQNIKHRLQVIAQCKVPSILQGNIPLLQTNNEVRKIYKVIKVKGGQIPQTKINQQDIQDCQNIRREYSRYNQQDASEEEDREALKKQKAEKKKKAKQDQKTH